MDPQLSGFALGLLFGAAKLGAIGTIGFAIAWWRTHRRLRRLEAAMPDPAVLNDRLAALEQTTDYMGGRLAELADTHILLVRQLGASPERPAIPASTRDELDDAQRPRTP